MKKYDKKGKVDKGFELVYFNLSHRRKFIRTIEITIIGVILVFLIHLACKDSEAPALFFLQIIFCFYAYALYLLL